MNRAIILILLMVSTASFASKKKPYNYCKSYQEAQLPATINSDWNALSEGLQASIGSVDLRYDKHQIPKSTSNFRWSGSAWMGERVSAQIILWSKDSISNVKCKFSDFKTSDGKIIPATSVQARFVRYVITDEYAEGCGERVPESYASSLSADVLDNIDCFYISPCTVLPIWITIDTPLNARPGIYTSTLQISAEGRNKKTFTFQLQVLPQKLPLPSEWKFHLDLWQNPYSVCRVENVKPWSEAHWKALYPVMKMLADAGQKVITTTINKRPWNGQTQDAYDSMIGWTKKKDGTWKYDYTIFDHWVEFMMKLGINKQINCYSMVPWGNFIFYFDENENKEIKVSATPGTKEYKELWTPFLLDFVAHLQEKGWEKITRVAMDERTPNEMKAMLNFLNETVPTVGVALADSHKSYKEYPDRLFDLCVAQGDILNTEDLTYRRQKKFITTWYVCCAQKFPNVFTFSNPPEATFIGWYTMAADFDGFLRWAYNSWVQNPLVDSRFRTWPAGDTYIVYPSGRSSIRFERLREGIQDAEKIRILRDKFQRNQSKDAIVKLELLNETIKRFNITEKPKNLESMLNEGKMLLEKLSKEY